MDGPGLFKIDPDRPAVRTPAPGITKPPGRKLARIDEFVRNAEACAIAVLDDPPSLRLRDAAEGHRMGKAFGMVGRYTGADLAFNLLLQEPAGLIVPMPAAVHDVEEVLGWKADRNAAAVVGIQDTFRDPHAL